eukprot:TRINITY_DN3014_c0_g1_i1.p2 TRINITY_DN3014_c0_g1~~TRINITY_DN3014_c0_g1_i1.p2  ORF type:complete len:128 (-),score=41.43 TRINITY_DN3014_c0_g1_i1:65-448(-)
MDDASAVGSVDGAQFPAPGDDAGGFHSEYFASDDCSGVPVEFSWISAECQEFSGTSSVLVDCSKDSAKVTACADDECSKHCDTVDEVELGKCVKLSETRSVRYACAGSCVVVSGALLLASLLVALLE